MPGNDWTKTRQRGSVSNASEEKKETDIVAVTTYKKGSERVQQLVDDVVNKSRGDLVNAKIRLVEASRLTGNVAARVTQASPGDRVDGYDLVLVYDGGVFSNADDTKGKALLDHGMGDWEGVEKRGRKGSPARTVYQRRKAIRVHLDVVRRNGPVLSEWLQVKETFSQLTLPGFTDKPAESKPVRKSSGGKPTATPAHA